MFCFLNENWLRRNIQRSGEDNDDVGSRVFAVHTRRGKARRSGVHSAMRFDHLRRHKKASAKSDRPKSTRISSTY